MADSDSPDTDRTAVTTYVPQYQKSKWKSHANDLEMSLSEFVRSMVQAGRRGFGEESANISDDDSSPANSQTTSIVEQGHSDGLNPRGNLREIILDTIEEHGPLTWDELVDIVTDGWEDDIETELIELAERDRIDRSFRTNEISLPEDHT